MSGAVVDGEEAEEVEVAINDPLNGADEAPAGAHPIHISNVAKAATIEDIKSFFAFCGAVGDVTLKPQGDGELFQEGTVRFHSTQAAETALLLDKAMIVDKPITIREADKGPSEDNFGAPPLDVGDEGGESVNLGEGGTETKWPADGGRTRPMTSFDQIEEPSAGPLPGAMPEGFVPRAAGSERSSGGSPDEKLAVILALLAAGYQLGQQALDFLKATQAAQTATAAASAAVALVAQTVADVDERHGVSEKVRQFDQEHKVSEKVEAVRVAATEQAEVIRATAGPMAAQAARATVSTVSSAVETAGPVVAAAAESASVALHSAVETATPVVQSAVSQVSATVSEQLEDERVQQRLQGARAALTSAKSWAFSMLADGVDRAQSAWSARNEGGAQGERAPAHGVPHGVPSNPSGGGYGGL